MSSPALFVREKRQVSSVCRFSCEHFTAFLQATVGWGSAVNFITDNFYDMHNGYRKLFCWIRPSSPGCADCAAGCDGADVLIIMSARETMIVRSLTSREAPYVFPVYISRVSTALSHSLCELTELPSTRHGSGHDLYHYALSCRCPVLAASGSLWSSLRSVVPAVSNKPCASVRKVSCCC